MYTVYKATCIINGKLYIGITGNPFDVRQKQHFYDGGRVRPKSVFARAIKKHGRDAFLWNLVAEQLSKEEAEQLEIELIAHYRKLGYILYNVAPGGAAPFLGVPFTEEHRRNISLGKKGLKTPVFLAAMAKRRGVSFSGSALANVRIANAYSLLCINDGRRYQSIVQAASVYGISRSAISQSCKNGTPTKFGLSFRSESAPKSSAVAQRQKRVVCLDDGHVFDSVLAASSHYNICPPDISSVCQGDAASAKGLHFAYYSDGFCEDKRHHLLELAIERSSTNGWTKRRAEPHRTVLKHPVICLTDGKFYESVSAASKAYSLDASSISKMCRKGVPTKKGLHFMYADNAPNVPLLSKGN